MIEHHWDAIKIALWNAVWAANLAALSPMRASVVRSLRVGHMMIRELADGQLNVRAASLVYTTLLSIVPVLAVAFALLKGFGVHQDLEPLLLQYVEPLGAEGVDLVRRVITSVENLKVGRLGVLGLVVLLYTVVRVVQKVEQALNYTWRVKHQRRFFERLSGYLSVIIIGPVLVVTAVGISGTLMNTSVVQSLDAIIPVKAWLALGGKVVPYLLVVGAFSFVYYYMPNTRVRIGAAFFGALIAGFLWAVAGWVFAALVVSSTRYTALYAGFAVMILFIMWLHISWLILLMGGSVAFYRQYPEYVGMLTHELRLSARMRERLALTACFLIARNFHYRLPPWGVAVLARRLRVPLEPLERTLKALEEASILVPVRGRSAAYVPARDPDSITLEDVRRVARSMGESRQFGVEQIDSEAAVDEIHEEMERAVSAALGNRTLRDLAEAYPPVGNDGAAPVETMDVVMPAMTAESVREPEPDEPPAAGGQKP
jgi:membrane protein